MGATVFMVANHLPVVNDITAEECKTFIGALTCDDEMLGYFLQTRRIRIIGSDGHLPQVKLNEVSEACNDAVAGVNLLILVGMRRALETNYHTKFNCPTLN
jgi:type II pantothenate kinase